ncbi:MAG: hypothetical protein MPW14_03180 [Candidatus Manganitrophus sp.]|nr:MAG: hypothetical protein MPW14_03180 [Candidatus Manganitrophus sp.]
MKSKQAGLHAMKQPETTGAAAETPADFPSIDLKDFFSASEARVDRWRSLHRLAKASADGGDSRIDSLRRGAEALLASMQPIEDLCAFPGPRLMEQVHDRIRTGDWTGFLRLAQRISFALLSNSYRDDPKAWEIEEEGEALASEILPPSIGRGRSRRPYFEILMVSPGERAAWPELREVFRRLRREHDEFIYEPVIVGSLEDALLAVIFNFNLQAVVISDGFRFSSEYTVPVLREILQWHVRIEDAGRDGDLGTALARLIRRVRPEIDLYLVTDRDVGKLAGSDEAAPIRRMFYHVEEPMEIHLTILDGVNDRYTSPVLRQPEEVTRSARSAPSTRCRSRAASRCSTPTGSGTWASSTAPTSSSPSPRPPPGASTASWSRPATSRRRRKRWPAPSAPTEPSSAPTAPRPRTRSWTRPCANRARSC